MTAQLFLAYVGVIAALSIGIARRYLPQSAAAAITVGLALWLAYVAALSGFEVLKTAPGRPPGILFVFAPIILFIALVVIRSRWGRKGDVVYPAPWARDASTSFLLSAEDTRVALEDAGFKATLWRGDTRTAPDWFKAAAASPPPAGPNLGVIMGPEFPAITGDLGRNIRASRLGVLSAVLTRD